MLIHLADALTRDTGVMYVKVPLENHYLKHGSFYGNHIQYTFAKEDTVDFVITYKGNRKVMVESKFCIQCEAPCSRCLKPVKWILDLEIEREIDFNQTEQQRREAMDEMNFIHEFDLDTETLIQEEIMLNFPMQVLCRKDCKGLCSQCGMNLNEGICSCNEEPKDPRMAAIAELFRQSVLENSK